MLRIALRRTSFITIPLARTSHARVIIPVSRQAVRYQSDDASKKELREQVFEARSNLQRDWDAKTLTYEELKPRTEQPSPNAYIIDVREPAEVLQGSIPSAVNLPLSVIGDALHMNPEDFYAKFGFNKPTPDQELVFYCRSGVRSTSACDVAKRNGYKKILNYKGSWLDWLKNEGTDPSTAAPPPASS